MKGLGTQIATKAEAIAELIEDAGLEGWA